MVMRKHQRYFPVYSSSSSSSSSVNGGELLPKFVTVANGPVDEDLVRVRKGKDNKWKPAGKISDLPLLQSCSAALIQPPATSAPPILLMHRALT